MSYIPESIRQVVIARAKNCCEYCLIHESDSLSTMEIDHIIAIKHRGATDEDNLCLSCIDCNRAKGSDLSSFDLQDQEVIRLFNPRQQRWEEHFELSGAIIQPRSAIGRVTIFLLKLNEETRVLEREFLIDAGRYPPPDLVFKQ